MTLWYIIAATLSLYQHFIDCAGIESPGLSSSPAIGEMVGNMLKEKMSLTEKKNWISTRKGVRKTEGLSADEMNALIRENPAYGTIICRCESITEGEILDAIHRPLGARSLDGVKRRTRAGRNLWRPLKRGSFLATSV